MADSHAASALAIYNSQLGRSENLTLATALGMKQKALTQQLDRASWTRQLASSTLAAQAILRARAFLAAAPSGRTRMEPALFITELSQRLGMTRDGWCPQCDAVLDKFSYHSASCVAGGERVQRHNALRDHLFLWADLAGLKPEKEKPHRPDETVAARRPADIFLPAFAGFPTALDLAVTAPLRSESLSEAGSVATAAAAAYAQTKAAHLGTAAECARQGITFRRLVLETTGAWEAEAASLLRRISGAVALRTGQDVSQLHSRLLQEMCVIARTHRARAVLRRRTGLALATGMDAVQHFDS